MAAHALYILDLKGRVIISRNYRADLSTNVAQRFITRLLEEEELNLKPIIEDEGLSYIYVRHNNLYLVAITEHNANAAMLTLFLYKIIEVFGDYFKELEEESIRDNFVIIYELLDEMMDFGYPQTTEAKILQEFITQESHKLSSIREVQIPKSVTGATPWRRDDIKYRKNEVFLDVVENINLLIASNGTLLRSEIVGAIKMRSFLSGTPELRLGLNDRVQFEGRASTSGKGKTIEMEDVSFHQCVRLSRFETDRTISFVPPDGEFDLMTYRLNTNVKPLIWIEAIVESHKSSRIEYMIKARSQFKQRSTANNVEIYIPVPRDADSPKFKASIGTVKYVPEKDTILWSIKQFQGGKEYLMRAHFGLPSIIDEDPASKPPITVKFEIPYFTVSGIQVRYLKIMEKSGYQALPWVRYITQSGDYQIRMS
jgi:AP-1 complex subunit mu